MHIKKTIGFSVAAALLVGSMSLTPAQAIEPSTQEELAKLRETQATYRSQQAQLEQASETSEEGLKAAEAELRKRQAEVALRTQKAEAMTKKLVELKKRRAAALQASYLASRNSNSLLALIGSGTLSEFVGRSQYSLFMLKERSDAVDKLDQDVDDLERARRDVVTEQNAIEAQLQTLRDNIEGIRRALAENKAGQDAASRMEAELLGQQGFNGTADRDFARSNEPVGGKFAFVGGGTEHGLGMSQYGAKGAANKGFDYRRILSHYYQGTAIGSVGSFGTNQGESESYLVGVIEAEMPSDWPMEALKAQAVAARSYAYLNRSRLDNSQRTQAWVGPHLQTERARQAVRETRGQVVTYNGQVVQAFFHSTSGGHTENNENVWGGQPLGWLRGVPSPWEADSPHWTWRTKAYSREQLQAILNADSRTAVGNLGTVRITGRGAGGRVTSVQIVGSAGTKTVSGPRFKSIFNTYSPADEPGLRSTLFGFY